MDILLVYHIMFQRWIHPILGTQTSRIVWLSIAILVIIINPLWQVDALIITAGIGALLHSYVQEKVLLLFLALRPTLDYWREIPIVSTDFITIQITTAFGCLFIMWAIGMLWHYKKEWKYLPLHTSFGALALLFGVSIVYSVSPTDSIIECIKFVSIPLFFFLGYLFVKQEKITIEELLYTICLSAVIPVTFAIIQLITGTGIDTFDVRNRIFGTFAHPNVFAFFILFLFILFINYSTLHVSHFWKTYKHLRIYGYIFFSVLLLFTYTRAALVGLGIFIITIGTIFYKKALYVTFLGITLFYGSVYSINYITTHVFQKSFPHIGIVNRLTERNEDADSFAWRQSLIRETIPIIREQPILGYGYGTFESVWDSNKGIWHVYDDSNESHNDYLRLFLETGVVGFALYIGLLCHVLYLGFLHVRKRRTIIPYIHLFGWIIMFLALSFSDNMLHHTAVMWLMWVWWGAMFAKLYAKEAPPHFLPTYLHTIKNTQG